MTTESRSLRDARILILEDDYYLATDLQAALEVAGATVIGPFGDEAEAKRALDKTKPDCAFIDVNLGQGPSFEVPRALGERAVPFVFVTGYDAGTVPDEFAGVARLEKPVDSRKVLETAAQLLHRN